MIYIYIYIWYFCLFINKKTKSKNKKLQTKTRLHDATTHSKEPCQPARLDRSDQRKDGESNGTPGVWCFLED